MRVFIFALLLGSAVACQTSPEFRTQTLAPLPEPMTNNPVAEGFIDNQAFVYTFGGLDSTKRYDGIHRRSYRLNVSENTWQRLPDLPDTLGKVASWASRVKDKIYILGGYYVYEDGSEKSSDFVHRFDVKTNAFIPNGSPIPHAIDDQAQAVWNDSLIYVITGWHDKGNVPNVQIYNPANDQWHVGTSLPDDQDYMSFGPSATIVGNTIYYFGGAEYKKFYPIQNTLRIGHINPNNPVEIEWSKQVPDSTIVGYRQASTTINGNPAWIGGSGETYNYNGIAYNGGHGVPTLSSILIWNGATWKSHRINLPMDLRGSARLDDGTIVLVGGMGDNQKVSDQVVKLTW